LKIVSVSTFPPMKCGIATYAKYLNDQLIKNGHSLTVVTEKHPFDLKDTEYKIVKSYSRNDDFCKEIYDAIKSLEKQDVVHIQHAPDLFPDEKKFLSLIGKVKHLTGQVFVTLHTVSSSSGSFYNEIVKHAKIIVHSESCRKDTEIPEVNVIPHGTKIFNFQNSRSEERRELGYDDGDFLFLFLGFIHVLKNLHTVVLAFNLCGKKTKMIVAGAPGGNRWYNWFYLYLCRFFSLFNRNIKWDIGFADDVKVEKYLNCCDAVLMPYWQKYSSASGIFHLTIGAGRPFLCSDSPKFDEIRELACELPVFLPPLSLSDWKNTMQVFVEKPEIIDKVKGIVNHYKTVTSWDNVSKMHIDLYRSFWEEK